MVFERSALDRHFAEFILRESGGEPALLIPVVSLLSNAVESGNVCLNLADIAGREIRMDGETVKLPGPENLQRALRSAPVVARPGEFRPLVLDAEGRLYLYRYWKYERELARVVLKKAATARETVDRALVGKGLERLFPGAAEEGPDWQKAAALGALQKKFLIVSGGPGTGKTSTVIRILALLIEQAKGEPVRIALAAPTGKSAMRLKGSIALMKEALDCDGFVKARIPDEVSTIHRLLGSIAGSVRFRHSERNPLPYDTVIVDEASMVALPLMAKLAAALGEEAQLILIGDRDQLASVEAGAVLGDMCGGGRREVFSPGFGDLFADLACARIPTAAPGEPLPPLADSLVVLKKNYRFPAESGIGAAGRAVNAGRGEDAIAMFKAEAFPDIVWHGVPGADGLGKAIAGAAVDGYGAYLAAETAGEALRLFDTFRFLCALHRGPYGVTGINALIEAILAGKGLIDPRQRWYPGRPVLITVNDYNMKLFNGDVGIALPDPEGGGSLRVCFPAADGGVRKVSPVRLPAHETVYAMTIHKSQGSEFDQIHMLLPGKDSAILTRELIYTGITRARRRVDLWGDAEIFVTAVSRRVERKSGLRDALWPDGKQPGAS